MPSLDNRPDPNLGDSLSCEVIQHRLLMLAEEGGIRAAQSAGSGFVNAAGHCASAIFSRDGQLVAQTLVGMPHVSAIRQMLLDLLEKFPPSTIREGDVFICNDPFMGGIHPTDLACFGPAFHKGEVAYFSGAMMIVSDMGGMSSGGLPATATEAFHEGLLVPPIRVRDADVTNEALMTLLLRNSRAPTQLKADIEALVGATTMVAQRMEEMIVRVGSDQLEAIIQKLLDHSEAMVRAGIAAIPDGEYFGAYASEDDGVSAIPSYDVRVRIKVEGSDCLFDFTSSAEQAQGAINSSYSQSLSFVTFALRCYIDPTTPMDEGFYRPFKCEFPLGSVVNPRFPAACNLRLAIGLPMIDAIHQALRPAFPNRSVAPSSAICSLNAQGSPADLAKAWAFLDVLVGPNGGRTGLDANDGLGIAMIGAGGYMSVEPYEVMYPVLYERFGFVTDSAGPGLWRGGTGISKDVRLLEDCLLTLRATDRTKRPPAGVDGGEAGRGGGYILNPDTADARRLPAKATNLPARAGDLVRVSVPGSGGYGDPLKRDPNRVAADVRAQVVSPAGALADYAVVITEAGAVDGAATETARRERGAAR